jgi:PTS system nitrogen regulatory IIA component
MPDLLTTRQLAEYLQLSERSVYRLLERGELPAVRVGGQWRFRKSAVDEWLNLGLAGITASELLDDAPDTGVAEHLSADNVILDLAPGAQAEVLGALVDRLVLPEPVDRALLLARLLERELLCSTAAADGIAVPHTPRTRPRVLGDHDLIAIARTREPVDFGALDGNPTSVFVLVLARDERAHLTLLAKVARLVREPAVQAALRTGDVAAIMDTLRRTESVLFTTGTV